MIYLIETTYYDKKTKKIIDLLSIGFTEELSEKEDNYILYNPKYELLYTREGDKDLETYLHKYFRDYRYPKTAKWYYYDEYIINNFKKIQMENDFYEYEDYVKCLHEYVIDKLPTTYELSEKYLDSLLNELKDEYVRKGFTFALDVGRYRSLIKEIWKNMYDGKVNHLLKLEDFSTVCDYPEFINLQEFPIKDQEVAFKEILLGLTEVDDEVCEIIEEKARRTCSLINAYETAQTFESKQALARNYDSIYSFGDYISVGIKPGSNNYWVPYFNDIAHLAETRALEIYQKELADKFGFKPKDIC